jgi:invasion protein IalB
MPLSMMSIVRSAPRRSTAMAAAVAGLLCSAAFAQQPPAPPPQPKAAPQPKAPAPAPKAAPKQQPQAAPQAQPPQQQQQAGGQMPVVYSPWHKICNQDKNQPGAKEVCVTIKDARLETGQPLAQVAFVEPKDEPKKVMRVTLPLGMQLPQGARATLDQEQPIAGRYIMCLPQGCMADFDIDAAFVGRVKKAQNILLQGINLNGQMASYSIPMAEFAKANEGPPTDPKELERQQRALQEQLQRRAEQLQKGSPQGGAPQGRPPGTPAPR